MAHCVWHYVGWTAEYQSETKDNRLWLGRQAQIAEKRQNQMYTLPFTNKGKMNTCTVKHVLPAELPYRETRIFRETTA